MRRIYFIRHATPAVQPNVPAPEWPLADRGIEEARALGVTAQQWDLKALYTSTEPKAQSTALLIGDAVGLPVNVVEGLEETRLDWWINNSDEFGEAVRQILANPEARELAQRLAEALEVRGRPEKASAAL